MKEEYKLIFKTIGSNHKWAKNRCIKCGITRVYNQTKYSYDYYISNEKQESRPFCTIKTQS